MSQDAIPILIRPAAREEAEAMTELAIRSKAYWGYDAVFMAACREELTITPARIDKDVFFVADAGDQVVGCGGLSWEGDTGEIEDVFVDPDWIGHGLGGRLMTALFETAEARHLRTLFVDADPNAQGFYEAQGFHIIGTSPSGSIPGRFLPRLRRDLSENQL